MPLPPLDAGAVLYLPRAPFDTTWNELAARYAFSVDELLNANPGARTPHDGSGRFARGEVVYIPVAESLRAYDYFRVDERPASVRTLRDLVEYVRGDPRQPIAQLTPAWLWAHVFHAELRQALTRELHPGEHADSAAVRALDRDPGGVVLPRGSQWAIPTPRRPLQAAVRVAPAQPAAVQLDTGWAFRMEHEHAPAIRVRCEALFALLRRRAARRAEIDALQAWCAQRSAVLGVLEAVMRLRPERAQGLWPARRAMAALTDYSRSLDGHAGLARADALLADRCEAEAELLWAAVHDGPFFDDTRAMMRAPLTTAPRARAMQATALTNAYQLLAMCETESLRTRLAAELEACVHGAASRRAGEAEGASPLEVTVSVRPDNRRTEIPPADVPSEGGLRAYLHSWDDAWGTAQTWALPVTGNLPGPPSVTGALLNLYVNELATRPAHRIEGAMRHVVRVVAAGADLDLEQARELELILQGRHGEVGVVARNGMLRQIAGSFQGGPRWTAAYGALAVLGLIMAANPPADSPGQTSEARLASAALWAGQLGVAYATVMSSVGQGTSHMARFSAAVREELAAHGSAWGQAAAWGNVAIAAARVASRVGTSVSNAWEGRDEFTPAATLRDGLALIAALMVLTEVGWVVALGLVLQIGGGWAIGRLSRALSERDPPVLYFQHSAWSLSELADNGDGDGPVGKLVKRLRGTDERSEVERLAASVAEQLERLPRTDLPRFDAETVIHVGERTITVRDALAHLGVTDDTELQELYPRVAPERLDGRA